MTSARALSFALLAALAGWCLLVGTAFVTDAWRHLVDSAIYILSARSLAAGEGYSYLGQPFFVRPPGLSALLVPFVGEPLDFRLLNQVMAVCAVGAFAAVALALRRLQGALVGTLCALLFAVHPLTVGTLNAVLSEFPFLALFFGGVTLVMADSEGRRPGPARSVIGALLLAGSVYLRSVGLLVLPGLVLADLVRRDGGPRWRGALLAGLVLLLVLPWMVHARGAAASAERPSTQLLMFDYTTALLHTDPSDPDSPLLGPDGWLERVRTNAADIVTATGQLHFGLDAKAEKVGPGGRAASVALAVALAAAVVFTCLHRRSLLDVYLALSCALLLLYFTFAPRLLLPALPLVISALAHAAQQLGSTLARRASQPRLRHAGLVLLAILGITVGMLRQQTARTPDKRRLNFERADRLTAAWIEEHLPADARVLHEKGAILTLLSGRTTYTDRNLPGPWPTACPEVDWALYGPRPTYPESSEARVAKRSEPPVLVPMPWFNTGSQMRAYELLTDD